MRDLKRCEALEELAQPLFLKWISIRYFLINQYITWLCGFPIGNSDCQKKQQLLAVNPLDCNLWDVCDHQPNFPNPSKLWDFYTNNFLISDSFHVNLARLFKDELMGKICAISKSKSAVNYFLSFWEENPCPSLSCKIRGAGKLRQIKGLFQGETWLSIVEVQFMTEFCKVICRSLRTLFW